MDYLMHYNKNHDKRGRFARGDGDGRRNDSRKDPSKYNKDGHKKGVYSAKIENYHKGTLLNDAYYIDKNGNKRSYTNYKDMPVEVQRREKAKAKTKQVSKKVASEVGSAALRTGASYVARSLMSSLF